MAGGLFGRPFVVNEKCIIFSLICMALFLYKPTFNSNLSLYLTLFVIFVIAYVAMAWYDFFFNCDIVPLKRGTHSITGKFKPEDKQLRDTPLDKSRKHILIYMSHLIFIVPILAYISIKKNKVNKMVYPLLGVMAIFTAGYHGSALMLYSH
jgi:peptidoglycan/LPS O-acetylase OafA/YrhL